MDKKYSKQQKKKSFEIFYPVNAVIPTSNSCIFSCQEVRIATLHRLECVNYLQRIPPRNNRHIAMEIQNSKTSTDHFLSTGNLYEKAAA
jgi:hypothetical protein